MADGVDSNLAMPGASLIPRTPGTYLLLLFLPMPLAVAYGRSRSAHLEAGRYCYVGSALGSGGLAGRLRRHCAAGVRKHWHIDYLLPHTFLAGVCFRADTERLECRWSAWVKGRALAYVGGFGASDCRCRSHLFYLGAAADSNLHFADLAQKELGARYLPADALSGFRQ